MVKVGLGTFRLAKLSFIYKQSLSDLTKSCVTLMPWQGLPSTISWYLKGLGLPNATDAVPQRFIWVPLYHTCDIRVCPYNVTKVNAEEHCHGLLDPQLALIIMIRSEDLDGACQIRSDVCSCQILLY